MSKKLKVDLTGVETFQKASEGEHTVKIVTAEETTFQGGNDGIKAAFEVTKGAEKGARVYDNFPLVDTALWKLKSMLQAIGMKADGKIQLDLDKLIGKALTIEVVHEEYNGQKRAKVAEYKKLVVDDDVDDEDEDIEEEDEDEEEEEKPAKKSKKSKKKPEPEDEDEDEESDEEDEEEDEAEPPKKSKKPAKKAKKPEPEDEEEDEDEEEEEEPPKKPAKKSKKAAKPAKKSKKPAEDDDDDDDDDWEDEDEE